MRVDFTNKCTYNFIAGYYACSIDPKAFQQGTSCVLKYVKKHLAELRLLNRTAHVSLNCCFEIRRNEQLGFLF